MILTVSGTHPASYQLGLFVVVVVVVVVVAFY
jgi:hypothetical protein